MTYNLFSSHTDFLRTDNPLLRLYYRLGDSPPPSPTVHPWGSSGSGMMTDDSANKYHLTDGGMIGGTDITIVSGLVPYSPGGGSGLRYNLTGTVSKRIFLNIQDMVLSAGALTATRFNRPSGWSITGWTSIVATTGSVNAHIINMSSNPSAMANGESFALVLDMGTAPIGHLKFAAQMDDTTTFILRANRYPLPATGSGIFWAVVYENTSTLGTAAGSGIFKIYIGDCRSSGVTEAATQVISNRANVMMEQVENTTEPLTLGLRSTQAATAAFIPDGSILDDISMWQYALTVPQLEHIKNSGITVVSDSMPVGNEGTPVRPGTNDLKTYWTFDNNNNAIVLGENSAPSTSGRYDMHINAADVTPVPGVRGGSGIKINNNDNPPGQGVTLYRNSGFPELFPSDPFGSFTWIGWVKHNTAFHNFSFGWNRNDVIGATDPKQRMGHGRRNTEPSVGGGLIQFDASGQVENVTTENMTQGSNLRPPLGAWTLLAAVWDNTNRLCYSVINANKILGFQHGPPSGFSRSRFDVSSPDADAKWTLLPHVASANLDFDDWAIYNRVLTFPEMSGYALFGIATGEVESEFNTSDPRILGYWPLSSSGSYGLNGFRFEDSSFYLHHLIGIQGEFATTTAIQDTETAALKLLSSGSLLHLNQANHGANLDFSQREVWASGFTAGLWINIPPGININEQDIHLMGAYGNSSDGDDSPWQLAIIDGKVAARVYLNGATSSIISDTDFSFGEDVFLAVSMRPSGNNTSIHLYSGMLDITVSEIYSNSVLGRDFIPVTTSGFSLFNIPNYTLSIGTNIGCPSGTVCQAPFVMADFITESGLDNIREAGMTKSTISAATVSSTDPSNISHWKFDFNSELISDAGQDQYYLAKLGTDTYILASGIHASGIRVSTQSWFQTQPGNNSRLNIGSGSFTVLGWLKLEDLPDLTPKYIFSKGITGPSGYECTINDTTSLITFAGSGHAASGNNSPLDIDSFNHIAIVYDVENRQNRVIINARYAGTTFDGVPFIAANSSGFALGGRSLGDGVVDPDFGGGALSGLLDDWLVFNRALTLPEISGIARDSYNFSTGANQDAGYVGGWLEGVAGTAVSGLIGAWLHGFNTDYAIQGGWLSGINGEVTHIGGWLHGLAQFSGLQGAWLHGMGQASGLIGAYLQGYDFGSGLIGSYLIGAREASAEFDITFTFEILSAKDFDAKLVVEHSNTKDFDARISILQITFPPACVVVSPTSGLIQAVPYTLTLQVSGEAYQGKIIEASYITWSDFTENSLANLVAGNNISGLYEASHTYITPGLYTPCINFIDSFGYRTSCIYQLLVLPSGVPSGIFIPSLPSLQIITSEEQGVTILETTFTTLASGAAILMDSFDFSDGQSTLNNSTERPENGIYTSVGLPHSFPIPGDYHPVWSCSGVSGIMTTSTHNTFNF